MQPKDIVHASELPSTITSVGRHGSIVWAEYLVIPASEFKDGMKRATCEHCESRNFIVD